MRLLVTGGAGFIGSNFVCRAVRERNRVLTVDKLTYAGRREALAEVADAPSHTFLEADIGDSETMAHALRQFQPEAVVHLAAESHVDRSIDEPGAFIVTNVMGTYVLLDAVLRYWEKLPGSKRDDFRFVHVSTDEVFGALSEQDEPFRASSRYAPNSPYAASKAAADHFARAWNRTYGLPVIVTNCSNNYGPRQHHEKLIPTIIRYALAEAPIPIYGTGRNVRDWLYVEDHVSGLLQAARHGCAGDTYLFGGRCDLTNIELAGMICAILDSSRPRLGGKLYAELITFVPDRPGHDFRYALDPSSAEAVLGWKAVESLGTGLVKTVDWYLANPDWLAPPSQLGRLGTRSAKVGGAQS